MKIENLKIAIACFLGAFIGILVARATAEPVWWLYALGTVVGGLVGFVSYEFKKVIEALGTACDQICKEYESGFSEFKRKLKDFGNGIWILTEVSCFFCVLMIAASSWSIPVTLLFATDNILMNSDSTEGVLVGITLLAFVSISAYAIKSITIKVDQSRLFPEGWIILKKLNSISVVYKLLILTPKILGFACRFVARTFILIHSEIRLICMVDAALGVAVGLLIRGNPLVCAIIGGIIGAALGVLNYELVSKRWLKLKPVCSS